MTPIEDRNREIEYLRLAMSMAGVNTDYETADLINEIFCKVNKLKGKFTINDASTIRVLWQKKWNDYHKKEGK